MKVAVLLFVVALCSEQLFWVACASTPQPNPANPAIITTTAKPWSKKIKDGLSTFFQGAAVVGAFQGAYQNHKSSKIKPPHEAKH